MGSCAIFFRTPTQATGPYTPPQLALITASLPATTLRDVARLDCLVRTDGGPTSRGICYLSQPTSHPQAPPPPPPYYAFNLQSVAGSVSGGGLWTTTILACTDVAGLIDFKVTASIHLNKSGGAGAGSTVTESEDPVLPLDCATDASTIQSTADLTMTAITDWTTHDTDADGCPDYKELGPSQTSGGLRDPFNPYDYFDPVGPGGGPPDGIIRVADILAVVHQFFIDSGNPLYNPDRDRTLIGPNLWNLGPPNGQQRVDDILAVVHQFFHDCE